MRFDFIVPEEEYLVSGNVIMGSWKLVLRLQSAGVGPDLSTSGMVRVKFTNKSVKIKSIDLVFDPKCIINQLLRSRLIPMTVATSAFSDQSITSFFSTAAAMAAASNAAVKSAAKSSTIKSETTQATPLPIASAEGAIAGKLVPAKKVLPIATTKIEKNSLNTSTFDGKGVESKASSSKPKSTPIPGKFSGINPFLIMGMPGTKIPFPLPINQSVRNTKTT